MDDETLIRRCLRQDPKAQRLLYERFAPKMMAVCRRYLNRSEEAEEALSNGFIKVYSNLESFSFKGSFEGWIRMIVVRECLMYLRGKKLVVDYTDQMEKLDKASDFQTDMTLETEDLMALVQDLPDGYRTVFNLYVIEGYKHQEIAEMTGITESTSKTQLLRARNMLQQKIKNVENSLVEIKGL